MTFHSGECLRFWPEPAGQVIQAIISATDPVQPFSNGLRFSPMPTIIRKAPTRTLLTCQIGIGMISLAYCPSAIADKLQVEVTGVFIRDAQYNESFGRTEPEIPFSVSIVIDESEGVYLPRGAPLIDGQLIAEDALVMPQTAVLSLIATLGEAQWTESDLGPLPRSDLGFRPAVILMGDFDTDSVKIFCALVDGEDGMLSLSRLVCQDSGCTLDDGGFGRDFGASSSGSIGRLAVVVDAGSGTNSR